MGHSLRIAAVHQQRLLKEVNLNRRIIFADIRPAYERKLAFTPRISMPPPKNRSSMKFRRSKLHAVPGIAAGFSRYEETPSESSASVT